MLFFQVFTPFCQGDNVRTIKNLQSAVRIRHAFQSKTNKCHYVLPSPMRDNSNQLVQTKESEFFSVVMMGDWDCASVIENFYLLFFEFEEAKICSVAKNFLSYDVSQCFCMTLLNFRSDGLKQFIELAGF